MRHVWDIQNDKDNHMAKKTKNGETRKKKQTGSASHGASLNKAHPSVRFSQFETERLNRKIGKLIEGKDFKNMDEINSFIRNELDNGSPDTWRSGPTGVDDPVETAQELAFQSMEADNDSRALALARRALELDPGCIDARAVEIQLTVENLDKRLDAHRNLLARARETMGQEFFEENRGHFWGVVTTRPYMRALEYLASLLTSLGRYGEAITVMEEMIDLNPNDNQGVRDSLLGLYLGEGDVLEARSLLNRYPDDDLAVFAWGRAIERFLSGDIKAAKKALADAFHSNPHVFAVLAGIEEMPDDYAGSYSPGDIHEAWHCISELGPVWDKQPYVIQWVASELPGLIGT